ncbi:hypothetical protein BT93_L0433 [Corymbia citriodora subsp. variegata]|uniref:FBD domain-containing protein n=1 Tax=Corymbia citriodora subsp. variegata TaxID=360336 RepID=A0A8T0CTL2_CORYI|nr:hypothetical protein BT93_L0433 [Corymbia citriodora subsp. variegata]
MYVPYFHSKLVQVNQVLTSWELTNQPCPFFAWKHVTLQLRLKKQYLPGISSLLRNSHFLGTLTIYVYPGRDEDESELAKAGWKLAFEFNGYSYWSSVDGTFSCLEHHLKHVKIYGYVLEPDVIELIEFLLKKAQVLEKMEISTKKTLQQTCSKYMFSSDIGCPSKDYCTLDALLEFSQKLLSFPRASTRAAVHLSYIVVLELCSPVSFGRPYRFLCQACLTSGRLY